MPRIVVFTDLDGTLLDHETYSWAPAQPALDLAKANDIPVVLASSKTAAEIADIRAAIGFDHVPAIVENGAGILPPFAAAGDDRSVHDKIIAILNDLPADLRGGFEGFTDWGADGVARETGLPREQAIKAHARQFSEPGLWRGSADREAEFIHALMARGVHARRGGRYLTLSFGATKADRVSEIINSYAPCRSIALGDAPNDVEMLETADFGVIISNAHAKPLPPLPSEATGKIIRTTQDGPTGWNQAVTQFVSQYSPVHKNKEA